MRKINAIATALVLGAAFGCQVNVDSGQDAAPAPNDLAGTYITSAHGRNLGKDWSYSGALVLDSTKHFGMTLTLASQDDGPSRESLRGTYEISRSVRRHSGRRTERTMVTLYPEGRHNDKPVLVVSGDTLRYSGPWWFAAGLSAMGVSDPVLVRSSTFVSPDSGVAIAASSTPSAASKVSSATRKGRVAKPK